MTLMQRLVEPFLPVSASRELPVYLDELWMRHFADVPRVTTVKIVYGAAWKMRLGLIKLSQDESLSCIMINALLRLTEVPEYVLVTTIAHELAHYAHGFGSPLPRRYGNPHANRVVERELERRELGLYLFCCNQWIDKEWYAFYDKQRVYGGTHICHSSL